MEVRLPQIDSPNASQKSNAEMDTSDTDEVNVVSTSPKIEPVEVTDYIYDQSNLTTSLPRTVVDGAKEKRNRFTSMTPSFHTIRETCELKRQSSDPILFKPQNPNVKMLQGLPKQHSDPNPLENRIQSRWLQRDKDGEDYFKVTCGSIEAKLIWTLFRCPGISQKCIKLGTGEMITPKDLVKSAGKQTLKDWKRAIRINNTMLRKHMSDEGGGLDYYLHETHCSNTCKSSKTMSDISIRDSMGSSRESSSMSSSFDEVSARPILSQPRSIERSSSEDSADVPKEDDNGATEATCQTFWQGVNAQHEMSTEIFEAVMQHIMDIRMRMSTTPCPTGTDAVTMTNIINHLGLMPSVQEKLRGKSRELNDQHNNRRQNAQDLQMKLAHLQRQEQDSKSKKRAIDEALAAAPTTKRSKTRPMAFSKLPRQIAIDTGRTAYSPQLKMPIQSHIMSDMRQLTIAQHEYGSPHQSSRLQWAPHGCMIPQSMMVSLPHHQMANYPFVSQSQSPHPEEGITREMHREMIEKCTIRSSPDPSTIRSISPEGK